MTFTQPPNFDASFGWSSFTGKYVIVEPMSFQQELQTKFGMQNAWDCVVWELTSDNELAPHTGIRIFNPILVDALSLAYRNGNPVAGHVHKGGRNGNATVIEDDKSPAMELLANLWKAEMDKAVETVEKAF